MKLWTKEYSIIQTGRQFFIFKEWLFFGRWSFSGEFLFSGYDNLIDAEIRLEEIRNPKNVEIL